MKSAFYATLKKIHLAPLSLQSDYAREFATEIAAHASLGHITTREIHGKFGRKWRVTLTGMDFLKDEGML